MLKLYRPADAGFGGQNVHSWDHTWEGASLDEALRWAEISHLRAVFDRVFSKDGPILEGGCGIGQFVLHYHRRGYRIEGVDFSETTITRLRAQHPDLSVRAGDVTALPYPDRYFQAYYSGGVVEHFEEGPFKALAEARRVLASGGRLVITVPFLNPLRQAARRLGRWGRSGTFAGTVAVPCSTFGMESPPRADLQFSEYYFTQPEFTALLRQAGFAILEGYPFDVEWGEVCQAVYQLARRPLPAGPPRSADACGIRHSRRRPPLPLGCPPRSPAASGNGAAASPSRLKRMWKEWFVSEDRSTFPRRLLLETLSAWSGHMLLFVCEPSR